MSTIPYTHTESIHKTNIEVGGAENLKTAIVSQLNIAARVSLDQTLHHVLVCATAVMLLVTDKILGRLVDMHQVHKQTQFIAYVYPVYNICSH